MEPLHPLHWNRSLRDIVASTSDSGSAPADVRLRRLFHLLVLTPPPLTQWFAPQLSEGLFELLLQHTTEAAALGLLGEAFDFSLSRDSRSTSAAISLRAGKVPASVEIVDGTMDRAIVRALCELALQLSDAGEALAENELPRV